MAQYNSSALIVDDQDPRVHLSGGWNSMVSSAAEYDSTKSGASSAGLTATFTFTGTGIEVYGSLGSIDVYGRPVSTYSIDGQSPSTYVAPIIQPGYAVTHVMFYRSPILSPGQHTLVITNTNGTKPCVYWLDYLVYTPSSDAPPPPPSTPPSSPSPPTQPSKSSASPTSASPSQALPPTQSPPTNTPSSSESSETQSQDTSGSLTQSSPLSSANPAHPTTPNQPSTLNSVQTTPNMITTSSASSGTGLAAVASSHTKTSAGAVAGGVIGGIVLLAALIFGTMYYLRRRRGAVVAPLLDQPSPRNITPFGSWPGSQPTYTMEKGASDTNPTLYHQTQSPGAGPSSAFPSMGQVEPLSGSTGTFYPTMLGNVAHGQDLSESSGSASPRPLPATPSEYGSSAGSETPLLPPARVAGYHDGQGPSTSQVRLHQDSGVRLPPAPSVIDVPPAYSRD